MKHTPGPWRVEKSGYTQIACLVYAGDYPVLNTAVPPSSKEEWESNAKLIAAAPDLLEACKKALIHFDHLGLVGTNGIMEDLRQAIKKAEL